MRTGNHRTGIYRALVHDKIRQCRLDDGKMVIREQVDIEHWCMLRYDCLGEIMENW